MTMTTKATDPGPAVRVRGLTKRYGSRPAVDGLDLDIPRGVVAGFIGPNGAGKTTAMAMLLGLVRPSDGGGTVLGADLARPAAYLDRVGALIESPAFWPGMTGRQNLRTLAVLGGHDPGEIPALLDQVGLAGRGDDRVGGYSLGMRQRLGIAAALLGDPELLVLDEPTNGLDPVGMSEMRRLVAELASGTRTVVVSSHLLAELEQVCDWLVVLDHGRLRYQGPAEEFVARSAPTVVCEPDRAEDAGHLAALLRDAGQDAVQDGVRVLVRLAAGAPTDGTPPEGPGAARGRELAVLAGRIAAEHGVLLAELRVDRPSLESHYLALVNGAAA